MAKHDQRILKFLNQNSDRAPTITEMMTRLNISISDISDSLSSLQGQGLITKKTTNQGIECWFPTGPQAAPQMAQPMQVPASHLANQQMPTTSIPLVGENRSLGGGSSPESRFVGSASERPFQVPEPPPPAAKMAPVQVQHIAAEEPAYHQGHHSATPPQPESALNGNGPLYGFQQAAPKSGIGFLTLALGLVAAVAVSTWLSGRLAGNAVNQAARNFVDKKALTDATKSFADFQEKTKLHVTALEAEVKKLTDQLASAKAADSLKTLAAAKPEASKAEEAPKGKAARKAALAKAKATSSASSSAMAKAAARGAAKRKKAMAAKSSAKEGSDLSSSTADPGPSESSPNVPNPPGLEELPPPPAE